MRVIFMGTSEFAIPALKELVAQNFEIIGVVTQPDRPSGRGKRLNPPPVKTAALESKLPVFQPERVSNKDFVVTLKQLAPDIIVVAAFGQLLPQKVLDIPPCGVINIHPSLLPKYRGAAPIQWALINGEKETGVTLMLLDAGEDTGDIICMHKISIEEKDTTETLHQQLAWLGAQRLVELLAKLPHGQPPPAKPQNHIEATHAPRLTKDVGQINWNENATTIHNLIRGTSGWPGAYTFFRENAQLKIIQALPHENKQKDKEHKTKHPPGTVKITSERTLHVVAEEGELQLLQVQPATKKIMKASDFINGYQLITGECFSSKDAIQ